MLLTASLSLLSLFASAGLALSGMGSPVAAAHVAFAVGILPLILAAMIHFVPVLTRTGDAERYIRSIPYGAQFFGLGVPLAMLGSLPYHSILVTAAVDIVLAAILLAWFRRRTKATLGSPHPGWRWYAAALVCLIAALCAVIAMILWPAVWHAGRLFHLHLNTLGLVGLAAFGTLPVLLPTALGKPDPDAAAWLKRRLWLLTGSAIAVAIGSAVGWPLSVAAGSLLFIGVFSLLGQWLRRNGWAKLLSDGVTASLVAAVVGYLLTIAAGAAHAAKLFATNTAVWAWGIGFLLPLVTGALSQLLPVWRWPGPQTPARHLMRQYLAANGKWRAGLALIAALCLLASQIAAAAWAAAALLGLFAVGLVQAVRVPASTR